MGVRLSAVPCLRKNTKKNTRDTVLSSVSDSVWMVEVPSEEVFGFRRFCALVFAPPLETCI